MRAVCEAAGVKMPTLYHFFGNKQGLLDAVAERGFDLYVAAKNAHESSGDPIEDLRAGWDAHVAFGLANPGYYTLMYGTVRPGHAPDVQAEPSRLLLNLTRAAVKQGRLVVSAEQAAAHILAANIGLTLRQIMLAQSDLALSAAMRDGVITAITGITRQAIAPRADIAAILTHVHQHPDRLGKQETDLLTKWLQTLTEA